MSSSSSRNNIRPAFLLAVLMAPAALRADAQPDPLVRFGTVENPLRRGQFETMRALAHDLDGTAQEFAAAARKTLYNPSSGARKLLASLDDFSRSATAFHERMDGYETHHWDVPAGVSRLERSAKRVNDTLRRSQAWAGIAGEWSDVVDAVSRMKRVVEGLGVQVPPARKRLGDYDRDYGPFPEGRDQGYEQYQRKRAHGGTDDPDYRSKVPTPGTNTLPPP
jgi:hypothetical protein